jgi:hypothetical protein
MNTLAGELAVEGGESLANNSVLPLGNPWFWDPDQLNGSQKPRRQRLLDTLQFLTMLQDEFYARYSKAMRDAGYEGEVVSSNWQAGRGFSHLPTCTPMPKLAPLTATITSALRPTPP